MSNDKNFVDFLWRFNEEVKEASRKIWGIQLEMGWDFSGREIPGPWHTVLTPIDSIHDIIHDKVNAEIDNMRYYVYDYDIYFEPIDYFIPDIEVYISSLTIHFYGTLITYDGDEFEFEGHEYERAEEEDKFLYMIFQTLAKNVIPKILNQLNDAIYRVIEKLNKFHSICEDYVTELYRLDTDLPEDEYVDKCEEIFEKYVEKLWDFVEMNDERSSQAKPSQALMR